MNSSLETSRQTINAHVILYFFIYSKTNLYVLSALTISFNLYFFCYWTHKNFVWFICVHKPLFSVYIEMVFC